MKQTGYRTIRLGKKKKVYFSISQYIFANLYIILNPIILNPIFTSLNFNQHIIFKKNS